MFYDGKVLKIFDYYAIFLNYFSIIFLINIILGSSYNVVGKILRSSQFFLSETIIIITSNSFMICPKNRLIALFTCILKISKR